MKRTLFGFLFILSLFLMPALSFASDTMASPSGAAKNAAMHNDVGISYYDKGDFPEAAKHFLEAIDADSKMAEAHYNLAMAYHNSNNHGTATQHFQKAYDLAADGSAIKSSGVLLKHIGK